MDELVQEEYIFDLGIDTPSESMNVIELPADELKAIENRVNRVNARVMWNNSYPNGGGAWHGDIPSES